MTNAQVAGTNVTARGWGKTIGPKILERTLEAEAFVDDDLCR